MSPDPGPPPVLAWHYFPPAIWSRGGGEYHYARTLEALRRVGQPVERLDLDAPQPGDLLHVFGSTQHNFDLAAAAKRAGKRLVVSAIAYSERADWQWAAARAMHGTTGRAGTYSGRRAMFAQSDAVVTSSQAEADQLHARYALPRDRLHVVPLGVDAWPADGRAERFFRQTGLDPAAGPIVLQVGRVSAHKGQLTTLRAARALGWRAVFIGGDDPTDPEYGRRLDRELAAGPHLRMGTAHAGSALLADAYAACSVHVLPSRSECPGLVNLEAARAGRPVVTGRYPTLVEYLGDDAYYVDVDDLDAVTEGVRQAVEEPDDRVARASAAVTRFSWTRAASSLRGLYRDVRSDP